MDAPATEEGGTDAGEPPVDAASDAALDAPPADTGVTDAGDEDAGDATEGDAMAGDAMADDARMGDAMMGDADAAPDTGDTDAGIQCAGGLYAGTFEGELSVDLGLFDIELPVTGEVEIFTNASGDGSQLVIENGNISGTDDEGDPVYARVSGVLNCETRQLENGRLTNGVYTRGSFTTVEFEGTVEATYEPGEVPRVVGTWATEGGRESGAGTFQASLRQ